MDANKDLLEACNQGDIQKVKTLLLDNKFIDIEVKDKNHFTPLLMASFHGHGSIVEILLQHGADIDARTEFHNTSLILSCINGCYNVTKVLLENGADRKFKNIHEYDFTHYVRSDKMEEIENIIEDYDNRSFIKPAKI